MTTQQDYYIKEIESNDDHLYTVIYDSISGDPFRVKTDRVGHYLSKVKRRSELSGEKLVFSGEWIKAFVMKWDQGRVGMKTYPLG